MVELQEASTGSSRGSGIRPAIALMVLVSVFAINGVFPWERFCDPITNLCFHAAIWSGTASLFGLLAEVLAVVFVLLSVARRLGSSRLSGTRIALLTGIMASAGVKLGLMFRDSAVLLAHQNVSSPVYVGAWLAVILLVVTGYTAFVRQTVLSRLLHPGRSFRRFLLVAVTVGVLGGAAAPYSLSGFGWWGGPLSSPTEFGSGLGLGVRERPNHSVPIIEGAAYVHNLSWTAATLDDLRLSNGDSSLRLVRSYVLVYGGGPCPNGAVRFPPIDACGEPLGGYRVPTSSPGSQLQVVPVLEATAPGRYRVRSFRLDYHVGFLHFAMTEVEDIRFCAPGRGVRCGSRSGRRP